MSKKRAVTKKVVRAVPGADKKPRKASNGATVYPTYDDTFRPEHAIVEEAPGVVQPSQLAYRDDARGIYLYHGDCLEVMDRLSAKYPAGVFDLIFADPPYFLSNGGITCHAGKMVKVDKGEWDKSRGPELNHEFNTEWLKRCQALLKPNGTLWVSGTHHVIFSVGYAMQQLGMKMLNQVTWQKPNPPPNLACRYFTHSTETILWAAKNEKSRHRFNYADMKRANANKQMKDVWTFTAPKNDEKILGKHPTQKPVALLERIILSSSNPGDFVLDPFMGSGTTGVVASAHRRSFVGLEADGRWVELASKRLRSEQQLLTVANIGGGASCANYAIRSAQVAPPLHWPRSARARGELRSASIRERQEKQRMGRTGSGEMHQSRSELPLRTERFGLGTEDHFARAA